MNNSFSLKSQISLFVIISALILILGIGIVLFNNESSIIESNFNLETNSKIGTITSFVEFCLENVTEIQIKKNLKQGGFQTTPNHYIPYNIYQVSIYLQYEQKQIPKISIIESELENSLKTPFIQCLNDFKQFEDVGYSITYNEPIFSVNFSTGKIISTLDFPVSIIQNNSQEILNLNSFQSEVDLDILNFYSIINDFIDYNIDKEIKGIPTSHLNQISLKKNFTFEVAPQNSEIIVYNFIFDDSIDSFLNYQFAIMYNLNGGFEK